MGVLLRDLDDHLVRQIPGMEEVVNLGQAEPEGLHQRLAARVVTLAQFGKAGIGGLPEPRGEDESDEAVGGGVAEILFQRAAVPAGPNLVKGGLDYGEKVPAVGSEHIEGVSEDIVRRHRRKAQVLGGRSDSEAAGEVMDGSRETRSVFRIYPPDFSVALSILRGPEGLNFPLNDGERFRILLRPLQRPVAEVDDAATRRLIRFIVEFLSVDDRHDNFGVAWVRCAKATGLLVT